MFALVEYFRGIPDVTIKTTFAAAKLAFDATNCAALVKDAVLRNGVFVAGEVVYLEKDATIETMLDEDYF